ncbi:MAG: hypothetical protein HC774_03180 [Sphingomonadales bacterium]|nr:hypothetical protein [Sphingomonadales bacterium]
MLALDRRNAIGKTLALTSISYANDDTGNANSAMSGAITLSTHPARSQSETMAEAKDGAQASAAIPPARTVRRDALICGDARTLTQIPMLREGFPEDFEPDVMNLTCRLPWDAQ